MPTMGFAQAKIDINGVKNSDVEKNIRLLLADVQRPIGRINEDKFKQSIIKETQKALQAYGYYDAEITVNKLDFGSATADSSKPQLSFTIDVIPGTVAIVDRVVLVNDLAQVDQSSFPLQLKELIERVAKLNGKPVDHSAYESLKARLKTFALIYGYFDFSFPLHKLIVQPGTNAEGENSEEAAQTKSPSKVIIHWIFYFGQRYRFGEIQFLDDTRGQDIALSVKPFKTGEYFEQSKVSTYSIDMQSTDYFSSAIARANAKMAEDFKVPIEVILAPKPKDTFEFGVGASTDTGPRVTVNWTRPWVNLRGHSIGARLYLSEPQKSAELNYRIPMANPLNDFYNIQGSFRQVDDNETESDTLALALQRQWGATEENEWNKIAFIRYEQESFIQGLAPEESTRLLLPGVSVNRTRKRGDLFVSWGDLQQLTVEGGSKAVVSDIDFFKITMRTKWIREFGKHRFLFRADAGAIATNDFSRVPSTQRFFAGGDQSIRGFDLNEISDFDIVIENGERERKLKGGKYLAVASVEYAYPVAENFRAATFFDAGSASEEPGANLAYGFGIGMHWLSPIGTVRLYAARGMSDFENTFQVHVVIGPGL